MTDITYEIGCSDGCHSHMVRLWGAIYPTKATEEQIEALRTYLQSESIVAEVHVLTHDYTEIRLTKTATPSLAGAFLQERISLFRYVEKPRLRVA